MTKLFEEILAQAQAALDQIAAHPEFGRLLESELWDEPELSLGDARQALDDLEKAYDQLKKDATYATTITN